MSKSSQLPCGCKIGRSSDKGAIIKGTFRYCRLHAAARQLLEALEVATENHAANCPCMGCKAIRKAWGVK